MNNPTDNLGTVNLFKKKLELLEDYLFGTYLYHYSAPILVRWFQALPYRQTISRNQGIIKIARIILEKAEAGEIEAQDLTWYKWPPWTPAMENRVATMLRAYSATFPNRPKSPLNKQEFSKLQERLREYL